MKLLMLLMTVCFAVFALPSSARENVVIHVPDTIETKANPDTYPAKKE